MKCPSILNGRNKMRKMKKILINKLMKYLLMKFESTNYFKRASEGLFNNIKLKVDKFKK